MRRRGPARRRPGEGGASRGRAGAEALARQADSFAILAVRGGGYSLGSSATVAVTERLATHKRWHIALLPATVLSRGGAGARPPSQGPRLSDPRGALFRGPRGRPAPRPKGSPRAAAPLSTTPPVLFAGFTQCLLWPFPTLLFPKGRRNRLPWPPTWDPTPKGEEVQDASLGLSCSSAKPERVTKAYFS